MARDKFQKLKPLDQEPVPRVIAQQLRELIMNGVFAPGEQLGESQLAANLRVSRGPVREALQRLAQEGLVKIYRNRGAFVVSLNPRDVRDIYYARLAIERMCVESICRSGTDAVTEKLTKIVDRMADVSASARWETLADLDLKFHTALVDASDNKRLEKMFATLAAETRMCLNHLQPAYPEPSTFVGEHRRLLAAIARRDEEDAINLITIHLEEAVAGITDALNQGRSADGRGLGTKARDASAGREHFS